MMSDRVNAEVAAVLASIEDVMPDAPPLPAVPRRGFELRRPLLVAAGAFALVLVVVGLATVLGGSDSATWSAPTKEEPAIGIEDYWEWMTTGAVELSPDAQAVTRAGPMPAFDAAQSGEVQRLVPTTVIPDGLDPSSLEPDPVGPVAYVGMIEGLETHVFLHRTGAATELLVLCLGHENEGDVPTVACSGVDERSYRLADNGNPVWLTMEAMESGRIGLAMLPEDAAVVVVTLVDGRSYAQQPRGGVVAFEISDFRQGSVESVTVLDQDGDTILHQQGLGGIPDVLLDLSPATGPSPNGIPGDWEMIFEDSFDVFDESVWQPQYEWTPAVINDEVQAYLPSAVSVHDGRLHLTATATPANGQPYTSGVVTSYGKFAFLYGAVEFRAKAPAGAGLLSALWMLPDNHDYPPEIDVIEVNGGRPDLGHIGYHWPTGNGIGSDVWTSILGDQSSAFHTYAVTWDPELIVWYVDGVEIHRYSGPEVAAQDMYLLANLVVGSWAGPVDESTPFPAVFEIDYVRVWQRR